MVGSFIDFIPLDLKPGEPLEALGMVGGGVDFAPPDLKPRGVIVVVAFRITRRGIELVPFDFEPGDRITSDWVVARLIDLAHSLTFSSVARPGPLKGVYRGWMVVLKPGGPGFSQLLLLKEFSHLLVYRFSAFINSRDRASVLVTSNGFNSYFLPTY